MNKGCEDCCNCSKETQLELKDLKEDYRRLYWKNDDSFVKMIRYRNALRNVVEYILKKI